MLSLCNRSINFLKNLDIRFKLLAIFYLVSHGGILLIPNAIFWDDWVLYRSSSHDILETFDELGSMLNFHGYLHLGLLAIGPWIYKILTFVLMFSSGILLNKIIERHQSIDKNTRFFIVLLFIILPLNVAQVAMIVFPYTLCYFLFFLAWALMDRHRILALIIFFISFNTNSLLVFYAVPFVDMLYRKGYLSNWKKILTSSIRFPDYILLPFIYFFIKVNYFKPYGLYAGYNEQFNLRNIPDLALQQFNDFSTIHVPITLTLAFAITSLYIFIKSGILDSRWGRFPKGYFVIGILIFALGALPYLILGHVPTFSEWTSRHQLLLPLGTSVILLVVCSYFKNIFKFGLLHLGLLSMVVGASLAIDVSKNKDFFIDWQKQQQLVQLFSMDSAIKEGALIVLDDQVIYKNAIERVYRFYEWNGMMELAFGNQNRFGIDRSQLPSFLAGEFKSASFTSRYKAGSFDPVSNTPPVLVKISLIEPSNPKEKLIYKLFPQFSITTSIPNSNDHSLD
jgi:hypothetical protein